MFSFFKKSKGLPDFKNPPPPPPPPDVAKLTEELSAAKQELGDLKYALGKLGVGVEQNEIQLADGQRLFGSVYLTKTLERRLKEWCIEMAYKSPGASQGGAYRDAEWIYNWIANTKDDKKDAA